MLRPQGRYFLPAPHGRGRWLDNMFIERLWRSVTYESAYLHEFGTVDALWRGLTLYLEYYNQERIHEALGYRTPADVNHDSQKKSAGD